MGVLDHLTCLQRNLYADQEATVRSLHRTLTGTKLEKEYNKAVCCHPVYLTYMQSTSCKMPDWKSYKLESRFLGEGGPLFSLSRPRQCYLVWVDSWGIGLERRHSKLERGWTGQSGCLNQHREG